MIVAGAREWAREKDARVQFIHACRHYSYRRATSGSTLAARLAGM